MVMEMNESPHKCSERTRVSVWVGEREGGCVFMDFCCFLVLRVLSYVSHLCRLSEQPGYVFVGDCACLPPSLCHTHTHMHVLPNLSASLSVSLSLSFPVYTVKNHWVWYWSAIDRYSVISLFNFPFSLSDSWEQIIEPLPAEICACAVNCVLLLQEPNVHRI